MKKYLTTIDDNDIYLIALGNEVLLMCENYDRERDYSLYHAMAISTDPKYSSYIIRKDVEHTCTKEQWFSTKHYNELMASIKELMASM